MLVVERRELGAEHIIKETEVSKSEAKRTYRRWVKVSKEIFRSV